MAAFSITCRAPHFAGYAMMHRARQPLHPVTQGRCLTRSVYLFRHHPAVRDTPNPIPAARSSGQTRGADTHMDVGSALPRDNWIEQGTALVPAPYRRSGTGDKHELITKHL